MNTPNNFVCCAFELEFVKHLGAIQIIQLLRLLLYHNM